MLKMAVSTSHVVVGIFLIIYSSIDPINITLPFSLIMHKHGLTTKSEGEGVLVDVDQEVPVHREEED